MKPATSEVSVYRFGAFELDVARFELRRDGSQVRLEKIPMEFLILLVVRNGELVTRQEIIQQLWGEGVFVDTDQGINTAVRKVRLALDSRTGDSDPIQTVVGKGYRFAWPVTTTEPSEPKLHSPGRTRPRRAAWVSLLLLLALVAAGTAWLARGRLFRPAIRSIAVLPLENFSGDPTEDYFVDGMTDAIITRLAQVQGVKVISRTSVMRFKGVHRDLTEIGRELHVDSVVEGSASRSGSQIRITAQLIDARTDRHLWASEFTRDSREVLQLQAEVAGQIARQVSAVLTESENTRQRREIDPQAFDSYLRARALAQRRTPAALNDAIAQFENALQISPQYADAYAGLADTYAALGYNSFVSPAESFTRAKAAAIHALELDPNSAEAHAALGYSLFYYDWNVNAAEEQFALALRANPNHAATHHWRSILQTSQGRFDEAQREIAKAKELDPLSNVIDSDVGFELYYAGQYDAAIRHLGSVISIAPNFPPAHLWLGRSYEQKKMFKESLLELETADKLVGDWAVTVAARGHAEGASGDLKAAHATLERLQAMSRTRFVTPYAMALVYAGINNKREALSWLQRARNERSHWLMWLRLDPRFDNLRSDPEFQKIVESIKP
jgi:TolB-like protein/DNA-binding winged helix-turn-helix (wHTH) protein/Tfp pilus assembly protein PilF